MSINSEWIHAYVSVHCKHERHDDCTEECEICAVNCRCYCHREAAGEIITTET